MSNHLIPDLGRWQVTLRVLFSFAMTAVAAGSSYFAIRWLAGLHH
jgi:hypothetical protein